MIAFATDSFAQRQAQPGLGVTHHPQRGAGCSPAAVGSAALLADGCVTCVLQVLLGVTALPCAAVNSFLRFEVCAVCCRLAWSDSVCWTVSRAAPWVRPRSWASCSDWVNPLASKRLTVAYLFKLRGSRSIIFEPSLLFWGSPSRV
eukprot:4108103-Amphidinium_carterae.1